MPLRTNARTHRTTVDALPVSCDINTHRNHMNLIAPHIPPDRKGESGGRLADGVGRSLALSQLHFLHRIFTQF